jgi:hypothetical protein
VTAQRPGCRIVVAQDEGPPLFLRGFRRQRARAPAAGIHHLAFLGAERLLDDRTEPSIREQRLEYGVLVRVDGALHDRLAQPPGSVDDCGPRKAALGVDREHDAGTGEVRAHHALHTDRERDLQMIEPLRLAVRDGAVGEQRRIAAPASFEQLALAAHVEERLLLPGEARLGQVFGGGAGAHGNARFAGATAARELFVGVTDALRDCWRELPVEEQAPCGLASLVQRGSAALERLHPRRKRAADAVRLDVRAVGRGGGRKSFGHPHALRGEPLDHFAERGILAADAADVALAERLEPGDERVGGRLCTHDDLLGIR